jgi:single-stranded DNA-binding protein
MLSILASGSLVRDPQRKMSAQSRAYVTGLMRVPSEDAEAILLSIVCFSENAMTGLLALAKGDALAVAGRAKLTEWTDKEGTLKHGMSVIADRVMSAYSAGKTRKAARVDEEATT